MQTICAFIPQYFANQATATCNEYGRTTRAYVSGYNRTMVHVGKLVRGEKRCLVANFNGAIPKGRVIVSATWRTTQNWAAILNDAKIIESGRTTSVNMSAGWGGPALVKAEVTLDNGEIYNQVFRIDVQTAPYFQGEANPVSGTTEITVTA